MKIEKNYFYGLVLILLLGLIGLFAVLMYSRVKLTQQEATRTLPVVPSPSPSGPVVPNPMTFLTSAQINQFFSTSPGKEILTSYVAHVKALPSTSNTITLKSCSLRPAILKISTGNFVMKNTDSTSHIVTYHKQSYTIPGNGTKNITNATVKGTLETLSCDDTKYAGVVYTNL